MTERLLVLLLKRNRAADASAGSDGALAGACNARRSVRRGASARVEMIILIKNSIAGKININIRIRFDGGGIAFAMQITKVGAFDRKCGVHSRKATSGTGSRALGGRLQLFTD